MASQLQDPGIQDPEEANDYNQETGLGTGHDTPSGDASDPRGERTAAGNPSDPRAERTAAGNPSDPRGTPKPADPVYDPDSEQPITRPELPGHGAGEDERGSADRGSLRNAEEGGLYQPKGDAGQEDPDALRDSEEEGDEGFARGFNSQKPEKVRGNFFIRNRRKFILGGGIMGGTVGGVIVALLLLIPLKIENIVQNLESRFFSSPQAAVSGMTQNLLKEYFIHWVIPDFSAGHCGTTVDIHCKVTIFSTKADPVTNLYRSWAHQRIENKLATKYHIELQYRPASRTWYIKAPGTGAAGDNIGANGQGLDGEFTRVDRTGFHAALDSAIEGETSYKKIFLRLQLNRLGSLKFGNKHYVFFNGTRTAVHEKISDLKQGAKLEITQRVILPYNQTLGIALQCLLTDCDATQTQPTDESSAPGENGFPENGETDTQIRQKLVDLAAQYGVTDLTDVLATYNEIAAKGFQNYLVKQALTPIIGEANAQSAADKIPIVGWLNLAAQLVNGANDAGPKIKKLSYAVNMAAAVNLFVLYQTMADEVHTGHVDATQVGSMVDSLNGGNSGSPTDPEMGGTASAEEAPVYNSLINHSSGTPITASLLGAVLPAKASAAAVSGDTSSTYRCNNGQPVPRGQQVCDEEIFGGGNAVANSVHDFLTNSPVFGSITTMAQAWRSTFGAVFKFAGGILGDAMNLAAKPANLACDASDSTGLPLPSQFERYCRARDAIKKASPDIIKAVTTALIPNPFGTNMSGGRKVDMMAAGADGEGAAYAQEGLGAKKVSPAVSAAIYQQQEDQAKRQFDQQPFFARMFDTSSRFSLVSSLAMAVPLNLQSSLATNFASLLSNPFGALGNGFASIFSGKTSAALTANNDPFGIPQYAYPSGSLPNNPVKYWDQHCSDNPSQAYQSDADYAAHNWNQANANTVDPQNGMPESDTTNPCLLIKGAVGAAGGLFDSSLLTDDDLGDLNGGSGGTAPVASGSVDQGTGAQLAQKLLSYRSSGKYTCDNPGDCTDLQKVANGQDLAGSDGCIAKTLDPRVMQLLLYLIESGNFKIGTYAMCGDHGSDGPNGHSGGFAVDISSVNGQAINQNGSAVKQQALAMDKFLNNSLPASIQLRQQISYGYGEHYDADLAATQQNDGKLCNSQCVAIYGLGTEEEHENHIHAGY